MSLQEGELKTCTYFIFLSCHISILGPQIMFSISFSKPKKNAIDLGNFNV